jgi:hypothetical protein
MWFMMLVQKLIQNPIYMVLLALLGVIGWLWIQGVYLKTEISGLKSDLVVAEANYKTTKLNVADLTAGIEKANAQSAKYEANILLITNQVKEEKERVAYWKKMYTEKPCFNNDGEVVTPSTGKVLDDEKSAQAVRIINSYFGSK